jgi:hypothetical protein
MVAAQTTAQLRGRHVAQSSVNGISLETSRRLAARLRSAAIGPRSVLNFDSS